MLETFERFAAAGIHFRCAEGRRSCAAIRSPPTAWRGCATLVETSPYCQGQGPARAAAAPRPDARQALRLPRAAAGRLQSLSAPAIRRCRPATRAPSPASSRAAPARWKARSPRSTRCIARAPGQPLLLGAEGRPADARRQDARGHPAAAPGAEARSPDAQPHPRAARQARCRSDQSQAGIDESIALLRKSLIDDENSRAYRLLANSYYKQGKRPEADAMIAQAYFIEGRRQAGPDVRQARADEAAAPARRNG